MATQREQFIEAVKTYAPDFGVEVAVEQMNRLADYYGLLMKWNERLHLVAPCSPREFAELHILESLRLVKHLPEGAAVIDVGSGGGLPIIPCLLVRNDINALLIESSQRKAVFLREALRAVTPRERATVVAARFENTDLPPTEFLSCRALDRFTQLLPALIQQASSHATLLLFAGVALRQRIESMLPATSAERVPHSQNRFLIIGRKD